MKSKILIASVIAISHFLSFTAFALSEKEAIDTAYGETPKSQAPSAETPSEIPKAIDPESRHQKKNQIEISPYGGSYLGNTVGQTFLAGGRIYFHLNNTWAAGINYGYSRLLTDNSSPFGSILTNNNMHAIDAEVMISNDAVIRVGNGFVEMDLYGTLGVGTIYINEIWEPAGMIGGGVKVYTGLPWLAFRIDVNNYFHMTEKPGGSNFDVDVAFLGGVSFLLPTR